MAETLQVPPPASPVDKSSESKAPSLSVRRQNATPSMQSRATHTPEPSLVDNLRLNEAMTESSSSSSRNYDDEYEYDVLYECQRGSFTFGYSSKSLLNFDPSPWCDRNMKYTPMNIQTFSLPNPLWQWVNKDWLADMTGDVDEAGWEYAFSFRGSAWHGNYTHMRSFARRRKWIRLRRRRVMDEDQSVQGDDAISIHTAEAVASDGNEESVENREAQVFDRLKACRLDRERLKILDDMLKEDDAAVEMIQVKLKEYSTLFDFEESRKKLALLLLSKQSVKESTVEAVTPATATETEKQAIASVGFFGNIKTIGKEVDEKRKNKGKDKE
ncbi:hypothetical protein NQZ79_g1267 [Umbelopsis isabellina]|nr:hypothetical protein NQZ79_g1267 [Umbelopsis isabellina]